mgnify:CR=1 FL=1
MLGVSVVAQFPKELLKEAVMVWCFFGSICKELEARVGALRSGESLGDWVVRII